MQIKLKKIHIENFKGCKDRTIQFESKTDISGANATGKTTAEDSWSWLLFDKDSTGASKFQIRPLDSDGNQIDNIEIMVEGTLDIDGKEVVLKKVQKQNWVKERGTQERKFKGNVNEFEINGYPKSEKDYKEYISGKVDEELFKLITNPLAFTSLPWKKQREVLMKLVDEISDIEIAQSDKKFLPLITELEQASTDDIQQKYNKAMKEWKKKQVELPARIDEISKQLVDIDTAELELQANYLKEQIDDVERQQEYADSAAKEYDKVSAEIIRVKGKMRAIFDNTEDSLLEKRKAIQSRIYESDNAFNQAESQHKLAIMDIERGKATIERNEQEKPKIKSLYDSEMKKMYPPYEELEALNEDALVCPTCGQDLPEELRNQKILAYEERKEQHRKQYEEGNLRFEEEKKKRLVDIVEQGKSIEAAIKADRDKIAQLEKQIEQYKADKILYNGKKNKATEELAKLAKKPDLSENQEYKSLQTELSNLEESQRNMDTGADYRSHLKIKLSGLREELSVVEKKIASADNSAIEERIEQLQVEQREVGQKVADQEKMIYLLEQFIRAKMDKISESINEKFKFVNFLLFRNQINGGMAECCEVMKGGVPYSALNSAGKIQAGLDIIGTLQEMYGVKCPIFIDNRESVTEIPEMDCQVISLYVAPECKELVIK